MPAWIETLVQGQVAIVMGILLFLGWGAVKAWKPLRALVRFLDQVIGSPGNPGLLERMSALESHVETIHKEVTPNHGGSLKDAVRRVEEKVDNLDRTQESDIRRLESVAETVEELRLQVVDD